MNPIIKRLENIKSLINNSNVKIIAVSKTFSYEQISPLVEYGHLHFGENKVQEARSKWEEVKKKNPNINLHMIGKLQSNKAKDAVNLFDYIHSLDNQKLANILSNQEKNVSKKLKYFIQVNIDNEKQKSGIGINLLDDFFYYCTRELKINIIGLMAIPPNNNKEIIYFKKLMELNKLLGLTELSMGMSSDFKIALSYGTTFVRIGSSIFGNRS
ncbi:YggS family pyridoxal phosphate-dependent enzyme [Pelagibacteraceae bacterium]|nr:YggS family pyridoxal phosphate-dependent enzyme [Pelagibacteraceae bacterium]